MSGTRERGLLTTDLSTPRRRCCLAALALALAAGPAVPRARGVDCAAARSAREEAICREPALRALDEDLAREYASALERLSGEGQRLLRDGQRRWLRYAEARCFGPGRRAEGVECLREVYADRRRDLDTAAVRIGPFLFTRIDHFYVAADPEHGAPAHGHTAYPHIDAPASEATRAWNALAAPTADAVREGYCDGPGDVSLGFRVASATAQAVSVLSTTDAYCHGAPHGQEFTIGRTWLLRPSVRLLGAEDLFDAGKPWAEVLTDRCAAALEQQAPGALTDADRARVRRAVSDPRAWASGPGGLILTLSAGTVLAYPRGPTVVTIPWAELRPVLSASAPVPEG